jgi:hypothetical protein
MSIAHVLQEVGDGRRRIFGVELERDVALVVCRMTMDALLFAFDDDGLVDDDLLHGTSFGNGPPPPVGAFAILSTTSMPWITLPNTV